MNISNLEALTSTPSHSRQSAKHFKSITSNLSDFEVKALEEIRSQLGYAPTTIDFNGAFIRFATKDKPNNKDGAYIANEWDFNGKPYARISFCNFAGSGEWHKWESCKDSDLKDWTEENREKWKTELKRRKEEAKKKIEEDEERRKIEAINEWQKMENNSLDFLPEYFKKKGFDLEDLECDSILRIGDDFIAYPLINVKGEITGFQRIYSNGKKRFKGITKGSFHKLGTEIIVNRDIEKLNVCYIVEGYATGLTIFRATGKPVYIANTAYNLKATLEAAIKEVRAINPNCLMVIAADSDKSGTGEREAEKACKDKLGVIYKLPYLDLIDTNDEDRSSLDYDDLRQIEGLEEVNRQLNPKKLIKSIGFKYFEYKNQYIEIGYLDKEKERLDLQNFNKLTNFIIEPAYEVNDKQKGRTRYVRLIGQKETTKELFYTASDINTEIEFKKWVHSKGRFLIEKGFSVDKLKKYLMEKKALIVDELEQSGKHGSAWYFGNCGIKQKQLIQPDKLGFFDNGTDERGNKLGLVLNVDDKLPKLNLELKKEETKELARFLVKNLIATYGIKAVFALGCQISGFFREEIAEATGTGQYPALWLYGEKQTGKSNLINILEHLNGYQKKSGKTGTSTKAELETCLQSRSSLAFSIIDIKPKHMPIIEQILQDAYDGAMRGKKVRQGNDWVSSHRKPKSFIVCDSNHFPSMESVIERVIPIQFDKHSFSIQEAKKLNSRLNDLSAITREILLQTDSLEFADKFKQLLNSKELRELQPRQALSCLYGSVGAIEFLKFAQFDDSAIEEIAKSLNEWMQNIFIPGMDEVKVTGDIVNKFLEFMLYSVLPSIKEEEEKKGLIGETTDEKGNRALKINNKLWNQSLEAIEDKQHNRGFGKDDIQRAIKGKDWIVYKTIKFNVSSHKGYVVRLANSEVSDQVKSFSLKSSFNDDID